MITQRGTVEINKERQNLKVGDIVIGEYPDGTIDINEIIKNEVDLNGITTSSIKTILPRCPKDILIISTKGIFDKWRTNDE